MDLKQIAKQTAQTLTSYLTYRAMRVVVDQLRETNPGLAVWLGSFSSTGNLQDGEAYLTELMQANRELALRIMTVREYLANEIVDFLPEMARSQIQAANMMHRKHLLERLTQMADSPPIDPTEES